MKFLFCLMSVAFFSELANASVVSVSFGASQCTDEIARTIKFQEPAVFGVAEGSAIPRMEPALFSKSPTVIAVRKKWTCSSEIGSGSIEVSQFNDERYFLIKTTTEGTVNVLGIEMLF